MNNVFDIYHIHWPCWSVKLFLSCVMNPASSYNSWPILPKAISYTEGVGKPREKLSIVCESAEREGNKSVYYSSRKQEADIKSQIWF